MGGDRGRHLSAAVSLHLRAQAIARAESVQFRGLPAVRWGSADGASAIATLQGAQLVSWSPVPDEEILFVSGRSGFAQGRPIRGGIPVCFPQFAERGPLAKHGFARTLPWRFVGVEERPAGAQARFTLASSAATLALWPHAFELELAATVGARQLDVELQVANTGAAAFAFAAALHTYLRVSDATTARLTGLQGVGYADREPPTSGTELRQVVEFAEPIDRVYYSAPPSTMLEEGGRVRRISQRGFPDTVVWNPGAALAATMADMDPEGWRRMLCVEAAAVDPAIVLEPGARWSGGQSISA
jgi:glucose-6-phosphate 1-epimerase